MSMTHIQPRCTIVDLVTELFPPQEHDRWFLTPQPGLNMPVASTPMPKPRAIFSSSHRVGDWPALAMMKGHDEGVYRLLLRLKRGN